MLFTLAVNAAPFAQPIIGGSFLPTGGWKVLEPYTNPALSGLEIDLATFSTHAGKAVMSEIGQVSFQ